jgi:hypothetical protein
MKTKTPDSLAKRVLATRGISILAIAVATIAAGCGSQAASRPATTTVDRAAGVDGMTAQAQLTRRAACRKIVLKRTTPGPARQRGLAACAVNSRYP